MAPSQSRLFIEAIHKSAGDAWPNWSPPERVSVGDYGVVDKDTGLFVKEGNVYDPDFAAEVDLGKHQPESHNPDDQMVIVSSGARSLEFGTGVAATFGGMATGSIKGHWKFTKGHGAVLAMIKPQLTTFPSETVLKHLHTIPALQDKALVTGVYACPMYALLVTDDGGSEAALAVGTNDSAGFVSAGVNGKWMTQCSSGHWRYGGEDGTGKFFPLFKLRTPKTVAFWKTLLNYRATPPVEPTGDDTFRPYPAPWEVIDENDHGYVPETSDQED